MAEYIITKKSNLVAVADSIRERTGGTGKITLGEMINDINHDIGIDTSDATASENEILLGETAYVDGEKITGTFTIEEELTTQDDLISQIQAALEDKATGVAGEDVTAETNTYTSKLATLETAITALETELQGKAGGGSNGGSIETCTVTIDVAEVKRTEIFYCLVTTIEDGKIVSHLISESSVITNAIKNSTIILFYNEAALLGYDSTLISGNQWWPVFTELGYALIISFGTLVDNTTIYVE